MTTSNKTTKNRNLVLSTAIMAVLAVMSANAADGDKSKVKGLITRVQGDSITIKDTNNAEIVITVSADTSIKKTKGLTGVVFEKVQQGALMPGLPISADVVAAGTALNATEVSFKSEDLKTAQQVQAGTEARMNDFGTYEAVSEASVLFASGSTTISEQGKKDLLALAAKSKELKDFRIVVQGFTDSTGNAEANQRLSTKRAWAVTNFLQQTGGVSPGRVQAGDGMGIAADAGTGSNANARKVVAKLVIDKGVNAGQ
jgi:outer membrane protein OmpA-like peptidoglycan-associated protein